MWPARKKNRRRLVMHAYVEKIVTALAGVFTAVMLIGTMIMGFAL